VQFLCIPIQVNMKFLGVQIDDHHKQKNCFEKISKLSGARCVVMPVFRISGMKNSKTRFTYFYSVIKYGIYSGGHSSSSGKLFASHNKTVRITLGVKPVSACRSDV
jgi:hypothetical protein